MSDPAHGLTQALERKLGLKIPIQLDSLFDSVRRYRYFEPSTRQEILDLRYFRHDTPLRFIPLLRSRRQDGGSVGIYVPRDSTPAFVAGFDPPHIFGMSSCIADFVEDPDRFTIDELGLHERLAKADSRAWRHLVPDPTTDRCTDLLKPLSFVADPELKAYQSFFGGILTRHGEDTVLCRAVHETLSTPDACLDPDKWRAFAAALIKSARHRQAVLAHENSHVSYYHKPFVLVPRTNKIAWRSMYEQTLEEIDAAAPLGDQFDSQSLARRRSDIHEGLQLEL